MVETSISFFVCLGLKRAGEKMLVVGWTKNWTLSIRFHFQVKLDFYLILSGSKIIYYFQFCPNAMLHYFRIISNRYFDFTRKNQID